MVVLEKWVPKKPISIYYDEKKERYYLKRFLVETENRKKRLLRSILIQRNCIDRLPSCGRNYFPKIKGVQKESITIDVEDFIAVKDLKH
jgi:topoisomerase-4 subunit A